MTEWMNEWIRNEWMNFTKLKMLITRPVQLFLIIASLDVCNRWLICRPVLDGIFFLLLSIYC